MATKREEETRQWAREEWVKLDREKTLAEQAACTHAKSGTIHDGVVVCDDCRKPLTLDDVHYNDAPYAAGSIERRGIDKIRGGK